MIDSDYKFIKKPDFQKLAKQFTEELSAVAKGEKSQLHYLKTYLPEKPIFTSGTFQVIIIGGTNYAFYLIEVDEKGLRHLLNRERGKLPQISSTDVLTSLLDTHLTQKVDGITANIGFPLKYFQGEKGQPDGVFIKATKEHSLMGLLGHKVGDIILDRYIRKFNAYTTVAVANDVTCITMDDVGIVLGTGYNLGLQGKDEQGNYIVNLEAGNSAVYESTEELEEIDKNSTNPGTNRFEKLISGQYLPQHFNLIAKKHNSTLSISKAEELSELASTDFGLAGGIARELFQRSAHYVAMHLAGSYMYKQSPKTFTVTAEGSLYVYGYKYHKSLQDALRELLGNSNFSINSPHDITIQGALRLLVA